MINKILAVILLTSCISQASDVYIDNLNSEFIKEVEVQTRPNSGFPEILQDIASRLPSNTDAKDSDLVTFSHEGTHFLSRSSIADKHAIYIGKGYKIYLPIPPLKTADLFRKIPINERGKIYETYRRQGSHYYWKTRPTMVIEEWVSYTHGSIARQQLQLATRSETDRFCAIMANYSWHLIQLAEKIDYEDLQPLKDFCAWNNDRCIKTIPDWQILFNKQF